MSDNAVSGGDGNRKDRDESQAPEKDTTSAPASGNRREDEEREPATTDMAQPTKN